MTLSSLGKRVGQLASDHSPLILTAVGVVGTVTTAVLTGKAAIKAHDLVQAEERARHHENNVAGELVIDEVVSMRDAFLISWRFFTPPVLSGLATISCIICANQIGTRRAAAMAAAYSLSERAYVEYKEKVVEQLGKTKEQRVRDSIAEDRIRNQPATDRTVLATGNGSDLCYEKFTDRYFYSSVENIKHAQNRVNKDIVNGVYASLSDFYDYLGLGHTGISDELGWNGDRLMEITFSTSVADNGSPCHVFEYHVEPVRNYFRVH